LIDYTINLSYVDAGTITDALALRDLGHGIDPPAAVDEIHIVRTEDVLNSVWNGDFEGSRGYVLRFDEASIFTDFPV